MNCTKEEMTSRLVIWQVAVNIIFRASNWRKQSFAVVLFASVCGLVNNSYAEAKEKPATKLSLDQLKNGLAKRFDNIENLTIVCTATEVIVDGIPPKNFPRDISPGGGPPRINVASYLGDSVLGYPWIIGEHRVHKNMRHTKLIYPQVGVFTGAPPMPKPDLPFMKSSKQNLLRHYIDAWDGKVWTHLESNGDGQISEDFSPKVLNTLFFKYIDYPESELRLRETDNLYLPNSIQTTKASVLPDYEEVLGHKCHVIVVPGVDQLWVDVACGYAVVKRVTRFSQNGSLRRVLVAKDWQEVNRGIWLPARVEIEFYCSPNKHPTGEGKVASRIEMNAKFSTTPLGPEKFRIEFPKGVDVWDHRTGETYVVGGGRSGWDDALNAATNNYEARSSARRFWWKIGCLAIFSIVCASLIIRRLGWRLRRLKSE